MPKAPTATKRTAAKKTAAAVPNGNATPADTVDPLDSWYAPLDETVDFLNAVYYGREGSTKTTSAATMANLPGKGKILFINAEGGVKKKPLQKRGIDTSRIVLWPDPKKHRRVTREGLDRVFRHVKADLMDDPESWVGVVFDSVTEIHTAVLDSVTDRRVKVLTDKGEDIDPDFVDIADYGTMTKMMRDLLRKFRDLPCHFVVTALERRDIDKDTGKPQYGPAVTPGLQADLLGYVDFVLMFKAPDEDGPARALTRSNRRYRAKDRFDVLPRVLAEPTFERMVAYVESDLSEETDEVQATLSKAAKKAQDAPPAEEEEETDSDDEDEEKTDATD